MATDQVFVYTMNKGIQGGGWSRYIFPWSIEHFTHLENELYMRHGDDISYAVNGALDDDGVNFQGVMQWPWLDFGNPGVNKMMIGFDIQAYGTSTIEIGYDQTNLGTFTDPYPIPADTVPGQIIPLQVNAPSMSVKLTFDGGQDWQWNALQIWFNDQRSSA